MSEKENIALKKLAKNISNLPDSKKEYLLGLADGMALMTEPAEKKEEADSEQPT